MRTLSVFCVFNIKKLVNDIDNSFLTFFKTITVAILSNLNTLSK